MPRLRKLLYTRGTYSTKLSIDRKNSKIINCSMVQHVFLVCVLQNISHNFEVLFLSLFSLVMTFEKLGIMELQPLYKVKIY